jgi:hypothetical protein
LHDDAIRREQNKPADDPYIARGLARAACSLLLSYYNVPNPQLPKLYTTRTKYKMSLGRDSNIINTA